MFIKYNENGTKIASILLTIAKIHDNIYLYKHIYV